MVETLASHSTHPLIVSIILLSAMSPRLMVSAERLDPLAGLGERGPNDLHILNDVRPLLVRTRLGTRSGSFVRIRREKRGL